MIQTIIGFSVVATLAAWVWLFETICNKIDNVIYSGWKRFFWSLVYPFLMLATLACVCGMLVGIGALAMRLKLI